MILDKSAGADRGAGTAAAGGGAGAPDGGAPEAAAADVPGVVLLCFGTCSPCLTISVMDTFALQFLILFYLENRKSWFELVMS